MPDEPLFPYDESLDDFVRSVLDAPVDWRAWVSSPAYEALGSPKPSYCPHEHVLPTADRMAEYCRQCGRLTYEETRTPQREARPAIPPPAMRRPKPDVPERGGVSGVMPL